jgi:hypothetical protein
MSVVWGRNNRGNLTSEAASNLGPLGSVERLLTTGHHGLVKFEFFCMPPHFVPLYMAEDGLIDSCIRGGHFFTIDRKPIRTVPNRIEILVFR